MSIENDIKDNLITAMKAKDKISLDVLRGLKAVIMNYKIEKGIEELTDTDAIKLIKSEVKKRKDSIESYTEGKRDDLVQKEKKELEILQRYLPEQISEEELKIIIKNKISEMGEVTQKDFGKLMPVLIKETGGKADNAQISKLLKEMLS